MDAKFYNGSDERETLTAHNLPAKMAPTCRSCGFVVYAVGVRLPYGGVLCRLCAEQAEREPEPGGEACIGLLEQQQAAMKVRR